MAIQMPLSSLFMCLDKLFKQVLFSLGCYYKKIIQDE